jgi:hypothetical protein
LRRFSQGYTPFEPVSVTRNTPQTSKRPEVCFLSFSPEESRISASFDQQMALFKQYFKDQDMLY